MASPWCLCCREVCALGELADSQQAICPLLSWPEPAPGLFGFFFSMSQDEHPFCAHILAPGGIAPGWPREQSSGIEPNVLIAFRLFAIVHMFSSLSREPTQKRLSLL